MSLSGSKGTRTAKVGASKAIGFALGAPSYLRAGWSRPLPVEGKRPLVSGHHGHHSTDPHPDEVAAWASTGGFPDANIALVLPDGVIGIDVDDHDGKPGAATIAEAEARWGKLPPTYWSSARPWPNGIRFYRVSPGLAWARHVGASDDGVEVIAPNLFVAVVAPSIHTKLGKPYRWHEPDGNPITGWIPRPEDLPELPEEWVEGLTGGERYRKPDRQAYVGAEAARAWFAERGGGEMSARVKGALRKRLKSMESGAHETARDGLFELARLTNEGEPGTAEALRRMEEEFMRVAGASGRRDGGKPEAQQEWDNALSGAVSKAEEPPAEPAKSHPFTDVGNARRLVDSLAGDGKYIEAWGEWVLYDGESALWVRDPGGHLILNRMVRVTDAMRTRALTEDAVKYANASQSIGKLRAAVDLAKGRALARAEEYDADSAALHVANGVLKLGKDGSTFRDRRREDMATLCAPAPYRSWEQVRRTPEAKEWLAFLGTVQPDEDLRRWAQTLVGYSLLGRNPERAFILAIGLTSSGKTTFANLIRGALGGYVGVVNLSLFRDKQDEGPRADLVDAMGTRLIYAVETSAHAVLHSENVKRLTGGDPLKARRLHSNVMIERVPAFTPWLLTNETPTVPGADAAVKRRLVALPFPISLAPHEENVDLPARLSTPEARVAILAWCVAGWDLYCRDRLREVPAVALEARQDAINEMSNIDMFLNDCCEIGPASEGYVVTSAALYTRYQAWLLDNGVEDKRTSSKPAFGQAIRSQGFAPGKAADGTVRVYRGLRLRPGERPLGSSPGRYRPGRADEGQDA